MESFYKILLAISIVEFILCIIILVRWWKMTTNIKIIREHLRREKTNLTYLVAIGEHEQAQKDALKMLVDVLWPIYCDEYNVAKASSMNNQINKLLPKILQLGLTVPDYVTTGEKFIDHMNKLIGAKVPYDETRH